MARRKRLKVHRRKIRPSKVRTRKYPGIAIKRKVKSLSKAQIQRGLTALRETKEISVAAKAARTTIPKFKGEALKRKLIKKRGKNWIVNRDLRRQMLVYSDGKQLTLTLPNQRSARAAGKYMSAVGAFLRSNNIRILDQFIDRGVKDVAGKRHVFETDPNNLYRLASSTDEAFESIYRIVVS